MVKDWTMAQYKLSFEMVKSSCLYKYSDANPNYYTKTKQVVLNSLIPDKDWYRVVKETDDPWEQYKTLKEWDEAGINFVRNIKLEKLVSEPIWEIVEESN